MDQTEQRTSTASKQTKKSLVVFNPKAGGVIYPAWVEHRIRDSFAKCGWGVEIVYLNSPKELEKLVQSTVLDYDLVAAAGGDGTISCVAEFLVGQRTALGILPVGTGNVLAKSFGVPLRIENAVKKLLLDSELVRIDAMRVNGRLSILNASVGITSSAVQGIRQEEKRWLGLTAYLWRGLKSLSGFQPHRFALEIDGEQFAYQAAEVLVVNPNYVGLEPFTWGPDVLIDDGKVDVFVFRTKTIIDLFTALGSILKFVKHRSPLLVHMQASRKIYIDTYTPQPAQIDGDLIGTTPMEIEVLPGSLHLWVPKKNRKPVNI